MAVRYIIDTHALIWFLGNDAKLGGSARAVLADPTSQLVVPAIVLAEACWLIEKGRVNIGPLPSFLAQVRLDPRVFIDPLDYELVERSTKLGWGGEMHDRQIVASALRAAAAGDSVAVLSADAAIASSRLVNMIW